VNLVYQGGTKRTFHTLFIRDVVFLCPNWSQYPLGREKGVMLKQPHLSAPMRHRRKPAGRFTISQRIISAIILVVTAAGVVWIINEPSLWQQPAPVATPEPNPTRIPFVQPSAAPTTVPDVVIAASAPLSIEFPSYGFNSNDLKLPSGQQEAIMQWTEQDNAAHNGVLTPSEPYSSSLVWDSTVNGGGLFGTDAQSSGLIAGHTTPYSWPETEQGVFQDLNLLQVGDPVVITTANGRLCYFVKEVDFSTPKQATVMVDGVAVNAVDAKYSFATPIPGIAYVVTCYRASIGDDGRPTTFNLVVVLQLDQAVTNAGSC
jgi:hypothetical protein